MTLEIFPSLNNSKILCGKVIGADTFVEFSYDSPFWLKFICSTGGFSDIYSFMARRMLLEAKLKQKMRDIYCLPSDMGGLKYSHNHFKAYSPSVIKYPNSIALYTDLGTIRLGKVNVNFLSSSNCLYSFNSKTTTKMQHDRISVKASVWGTCKEEEWFDYFSRKQSGSLDGNKVTSAWLCRSWV